MKLSKCYSLYYKLFGRKNNKNIMIMFLLSFAFSTLALLLFITSLSEDLYKAGSGSNNLTISVMDTYGRTITSPKLNAYIRELSKEVEVSTERFLPIKNNIGKEEKQIILRVSDKDLEGTCILSIQAAAKLKAKEGDRVYFDVLNKSLIVKKIEPCDSNFEDMVLAGYVIVGSENINELKKTFNDGEFVSKCNLEINIKGKVDEKSVYNDVKNIFNESGKKDYIIQMSTKEAVLDNFKTTLKSGENILRIFININVIIVVLGIMAILYLKENSVKSKLIIARIYGVNKSVLRLFAVFDAIFITPTSSALATVIGALLFRYYCNTFLAVKISILTLLNVGLVTFLKILVLSVSIVFLFHLGMYERIYELKIADELRGRKTLVVKKIINKWQVLSVISYIVISLFIFGGINPLIFISLLIIFTFNLIFRLGFGLVSMLAIKKKSTVKLALLLVKRRKKHNAVLGTTIVAVCMLVIVLYNVLLGVETYYENLWISTQGFNLCITESDVNSNKFEKVISEINIKYFTTFNKSFQLKGDEGKFYSMAVFKDDEGLSRNKVPPKGTFYANRYFCYITGISRNGQYKFFDRTLSLTGNVDDMPNTPAAYTVALNFNDVKENIDSSFQKNILINADKTDKENIEHLAAETGAEVVSVDSYIKMYKEGFYQYIVFIYITCILMFITLICIIGILSFVLFTSRKREFMLYRVIGAKRRDIEKIVIFENIIITSVATLTTMIFQTAILNGLSFIMFKQAVYFPPIYVFIAIFGSIIVLVTGITIFSFISMKKSEIIELLRIGD